jgi:hypothetical protein
MSRTALRTGLGSLVLGVLLSWGCTGRHDNEEEFAKYPGTTPPGTRANSEEVAPPAPADKPR